ncbi:MAG: cobalamin-binding protein [Phycisphaerales bacterium]|nr:cobalamin-binding protein [Phycisphaerales bacterium]
MRVVSLLPSATEILCRIGGEGLLVGRSHECDWPPNIRDRPVLTAQRTPSPCAADVNADARSGASAAIDREVRAALDSGQSLYALNLELLRDLQPDVILTQDVCAVCSIDLATVRRVAATMHPSPAIVSLNPNSIWDVLDDCLKVGAAVGCTDGAERAMVELREGWWTAVDFVNPFVQGPEVLFLEWMDPPFCGGHWTPELVHAAGARHSLNVPGAKSRQLAPEEILTAAPERIIICPCGYGIPAIRSELASLESQRWWPLLPANLEGDGRVVLVDGNQMFNRPGPRLVDAFRWLTGWINDRPELIPPGFPVEMA